MKRKYSDQDYVYTATGHRIILEDMTPDDVRIRDIAFGLGGIYRFNGHTRISVLRHSLAVYNLVGIKMPRCYSSEAPLLALLHDAAEAYMMDVPVPMKRFMGKKWFTTYLHVEACIYEAMGLQTPLASGMLLVDKVDKMVVEYEMNVSGTRVPGRGMKYPGLDSLTQSDLAEMELAYRWDYHEDELPALYLHLLTSLRGPRLSLEKLPRE